MSRRAAPRLPSVTTIAPFLISLPTADRVRAHAFYRDGLGLDAVGELADDGVPEPLVVVVNDAARLMLIPTGGFGWVAGRALAETGTSECLLGIVVDREGEVDEIVERARAAGATVTAEPESKPWGYTATFADPDGHLWTVTAGALAERASRPADARRSLGGRPARPQPPE